MKYQHILLAADFSINIEQVAEKAKNLAQTHQAKLSLLHVLDNIPMPDTNYGTQISLNEDTGYDLLEIEKKKLITFAEKFNIKTDDQWLVWGVPNQEIITFAEQKQVDLIVLGTHGKHGLSLLLGSTSNSVLHHAPCDILAVRL